MDDDLGPHHSVAVTGGEPLLQAESLAPLFQAFRASKLRVYLETAGDLPRQLKLVRQYVDWIAMDIKLPSVTGDRDLFARHEAFLREALAEPRIDTFAKCVVSSATLSSEIERAAALTAKWTVPLALQPVTQVDGGPDAPAPEQVLEWSRDAARVNPNVRVIPQVHKLLRQR
jgi:organic radical activating enzyme